MPRPEAARSALGRARPPALTPSTATAVDRFRTRTQLPRPRPDGQVGSPGPRPPRFLAASRSSRLASMQTGPHGDPRTTNPDPGPPPYPPLLGVTDWPLVSTAMSVVLTVAFFGYLAWQSIRQRSLHWLLDPRHRRLVRRSVGSRWRIGRHSRCSIPRVAHFPLSWPYFNISPLLEPTLSFLGGYASYYVLTGLGLLSLHRRSSNPASVATAFWTGTGSSRSSSRVSLRGFHLTRSCSCMWLEVGLFVYTEAAGPVVHLGGSTAARFTW